MTSMSEEKGVPAGKPWRPSLEGTLPWPKGLIPLISGWPIRPREVKSSVTHTAQGQGNQHHTLVPARPNSILQTNPDTS